MLIPSATLAVTPPDCTRTTHISHGGEADHVDLGEGRVMWRAWWSQEGTATDLHVVDCASGDALSMRTAEERMSDRLPFDRTDKALRILTDLNAGARVFFTFDRAAEALKKTARDIRVATLTDEPCACAAYYPAERGTKTPFALN